MERKFENQEFIVEEYTTTDGKELWIIRKTEALLQELELREWETKVFKEFQEKSEYSLTPEQEIAILRAFAKLQGQTEEPELQELYGHTSNNTCVIDEDFGYTVYPPFIYIEHEPLSKGSAVYYLDDDEYEMYDIISKTQTIRIWVCKCIQEEIRSNVIEYPHDPELDEFVKEGIIIVDEQRKGLFCDKCGSELILD